MTAAVDHAASVLCTQVRIVDWGSRVTAFPLSIAPHDSAAPMVAVGPVELVQCSLTHTARRKGYAIALLIVPAPYADTTAAVSGAALAMRFRTHIAEHPDNASVCQIALTTSVATTAVVARAECVSAAKPVSTTSANS